MKNLFLKRTGAVLLSAMTLTTALALTPINASANSGTITYKFTGDEKTKSGYAQGTITLSNFADGSYYLYWSDNKKALAGFYEIAKVTVKNGTGSFKFTDHSAIPADATKVIVTNTTTNPTVANALGIYNLPKNKLPKEKSTEANYSFMDFSDIHIDQANNQYYKYSELHWKKALEASTQKKADFIVTAGDNINNSEGPGKEYDKFQQILANSAFTNPVYEANGNHELRTGERKALLNTFISATGLNGDTDTINNNKPYYSFTEKKTGDLFIMMSLEYKYDPSTGDEFSQEQLKWLENLLKKNYNKNKNIYIIQHALIEGYGAGDDEDNYYTVPLRTQYKTTVQFRDLINKYKDVIWISGHTHIALQYGYNYSNMNDTACNMIHDSSVCCPTLLNIPGHCLKYTAHDNEAYKDLSEGYYVQVFKDRSIFYGENLYHNMIYPSACYVIEGCRKTNGTLVSSTKTKTETVFTGTKQDIANLRAFASTSLEFPKAYTMKSITATDLDYLVNQSKKLLNTFYPFSSYNCYQDLKKAIATYKTMDTKTAYKKISTAYKELLPYTYSGEVNLYFANSKNWKNVYAYLWSSENDTTIEMTDTGKKYQGFNVYQASINCNMYKQVVFSNGGEKEQTEEQSLSGKDNQIFKLNQNDPVAPYFCIPSTFNN